MKSSHKHTNVSLHQIINHQQNRKKGKNKNDDKVSTNHKST